jgi:bisphosphoglycerate-independent phosphoglycerate mutase (AlkP superfamily)
LAPSSTTKENARESVEVADEILDKLFRVKQYLDDAKLSITRGHGNVDASLDKAERWMKKVVDQSLKMTLTKRSSGKLTRKRGRKRKSNGSMWKKLFR